MSYSTWSFAVAVLLTNAASCLDGKHEVDRRSLHTPDFERTPITSKAQLKFKNEVDHGMKLKSHAETSVNAAERENQSHKNLRENPGEMQDDLHGFDVTENFQKFTVKVENHREMLLKVQLPGNLKTQGTTLNENNIRVKTGGIQRANEENIAPALLTKMSSGSPGDSEGGSAQSILPRSITNSPLKNQKSAKEPRGDISPRLGPNQTLPRSVSKSAPESRKSFSSRSMSFLRGVFRSTLGRKSSRSRSVSSKTYPESPSPPPYYRPKSPGGGEEGVPGKGNTGYSDYIKRVKSNVGGTPDLEENGEKASSPKRNTRHTDDTERGKSQLGGSSDHRENGDKPVTRKGNTGYTDFIERVKSNVQRNGNFHTAD